MMNDIGPEGPSPFRELAPGGRVPHVAHLRHAVVDDFTREHVNLVPGCFQCARHTGNVHLDAGTGTRSAIVHEQDAHRSILASASSLATKERCDGPGPGWS